MTAIGRRVQRLESARTAGVGDQPTIRVVIRRCGKKLNLATSTVQHILNGNGSITKIVTLDGSREDITDDELNRFVDRFSVKLAPHFEQQFRQRAK